MEIEIRSGYLHGYFAECLHCGAKGGIAATEVEAAKMWNTRFSDSLDEIENEAKSDKLVKRLKAEAKKHSSESELHADLIEAAKFVEMHLNALKD